MLFDPHKLQNPYAAAFATAPLPASVKIETGPPADYDYEKKGIRSETSTVVTINRGELETSTSQGDFLRFSVPIVTESATYYVEQVVTDVGIGSDQAFIPVFETDLTEPEYSGALVFEPYALEQTPYIPYEDLSQYNYGQGGGYVETAPYYDPYESQNNYYVPPDNAPSYVAPPADPYNVPYTPEEIYEPEQQQVDTYQQAYLDYLDYIAAQEEQIDYYGSGEYNQG